jgi:hypothetical protein
VVSADRTIASKGITALSMTIPISIVAAHLGDHRVNRTPPTTRQMSKVEARLGAHAEAIPVAAEVEVVATQANAMTAQKFKAEGVSAEAKSKTLVQKNVQQPSDVGAHGGDTGTRSVVGLTPLLKPLAMRERGLG